MNLRASLQVLEDTRDNLRIMMYYIHSVGPNRLSRRQHYRRYLRHRALHLVLRNIARRMHITEPPVASLHPQERGSRGRDRTCDDPVNSRGLYR